MIELFIEKQQADISNAFSTMLSYTIDDVKDFGAKNTAFSKTVILPGTKRNNILFGHIFQIGRTTQYDGSLPNYGYNYNAAISAKAIMFSDNLQVFKGVVRLMEIVYDKSSVEYEVSFYGELGGFTAALGASLLTANLHTNGTANPAVNLDFSSYNHTYDLVNIVASWDNAAGGNGYYYPNNDYGTYGRNAAHSAAGKHSWIYKTFRPALFVKQYIEKIFANAGYTYDFPLMETERFKSLIVPHNQKQLTRSSLIGLKAHIGATSYVSVSTYPVPFFYIDSLGNFTTNAGHTIFTYGGATAGIGSLEVKLFGYFTTAGVRPSFTVNVYQNGVLVGSVPFVGTPIITIPGLTIAPADTLKVEIQVSSPSTFTFYLTAGQIVFTNGIPQVAPVGLGESFNINDAIPRNILQRDFFSSIIKLFNLYVFDDPQKFKHLRVAPFIDFFADGNVVDWTEKLDRSRPLRIKPMSELNARYYEFKFKDDTDFYNDLYKKRYNESYGTIKYDSGYEFASDSQTVELIFSGTPLVGYVGEDKIYSTIFKSSNNAEECIDSNIRILLAKKITGVTSWDILDLDGTTVLSSYTAYGYAGHLNDPNIPANDIQFGAPKELFFTLATGALNVNQFNVYYSAYMAEITDKDSKLVTASFRLLRKDICQLDFSKFIHIDGNIFRLNKITDYNASMEDSVVVELLKVINLVYSIDYPGYYLLTEDSLYITTETSELIKLEF